MDKKIRDMKPHPLSPEEWREVVRIPAVREAWNLGGDEGADEFSSQVYAAKFNFTSGSPGYVGELYILQGEELTGEPPMVLTRGKDGSLAVA